MVCWVNPASISIRRFSVQVGKFVQNAVKLLRQAQHKED